MSYFEKLREYNELSQVQVAAALGISGTWYYRKLQGQGEFTRADIAKLAQLFKVSELELVKNQTIDLKLGGKTFGARLKQARRCNCFSRKELGAFLNKTHDTIALWEVGKAFPKFIQLKLLCSALNVSADYLVLGLVSAPTNN